MTRRGSTPTRRRVKPGFQENKTIQSIWGYLYLDTRSKKRSLHRPLQQLRRACAWACRLVKPQRKHCSTAFGLCLCMDKDKTNIQTVVCNCNIIMQWTQLWSYLKISLRLTPSTSPSCHNHHSIMRFHRYCILAPDIHLPLLARPCIPRHPQVQPCFRILAPL